MIGLFLFISAILIVVRGLWPPKMTEQDIDNLVKIKELEFLWNQLSADQKKEVERKMGI